MSVKKSQSREFQLSEHSFVDDAPSGAARAAASGMVTEMGLQQKAAPLVARLQGRLPTGQELLAVVQEHGTDVGTAFLWRAVQGSEVHAAFGRQVRAFDLASMISPRAPLRQVNRQFEVVLVASNLPESGRAWGDHVELWRMWARELGFTTDDIQTLPQNTVSQNARLISDHLAAHYHPHRIIVTFGQGTSEFRFLLEKRLSDRGRGQNVALGTVRAWLNVCGSFGGCAQHALINRSWRRGFAARMKMRMQGRQPMTLKETSSDFPLWRGPTHVPRETLVASLFGSTYGAQMPMGLNSSYLELSKLGPNDGAVLSLDAIAQPGIAIPVQGLTARGESQILEPMLKKLLLTTSETMAPLLTPMVGEALPTAPVFESPRRRPEPEYR